MLIGGGPELIHTLAGLPLTGLDSSCIEQFDYWVPSQEKWSWLLLEKLLDTAYF